MSMYDEPNPSLRRRGDAHETTGGRQRLAYYPEEWADQPLPVILRAYREAYGQSQREVADNLRIRRVFIEALEEGNYGELPGEAYASGFVRSYAQYLGLPALDMAKRFRAELERLDPDFTSQVDVAANPALQPQSSVPVLLWIGFGVFLLAALYFALLIYTQVSNGGNWRWVPSFSGANPAAISTLGSLTAVAPTRTSGTVEAEVQLTSNLIETSVESRTLELEDGTMVVTLGQRDLSAETFAAAQISTLEIQVPSPAYRLPATALEAPKLDSLSDGEDTRSITLLATGDLVFVMVFTEDNQFVRTLQMLQGDTYVVPDIGNLRLQVTDTSSLEIQIGELRYRLPASLASRAVPLDEQMLEAEAILLNPPS